MFNRLTRRLRPSRLAKAKVFRETLVRSRPPGAGYAYLGPDAAMVLLNTGHLIFVDPADQSISSHLIARGYWEPWIHAIVRALVRPGDTVVEVGANLGYYTLAMARAVCADGSIHALEANPRLARLAQRSIEMNGYSDRVQIIQKAAAEAPGQARFTLSRSQSGSGHVSLADHSHLEDAAFVDVELMRLDDLAVDRVDFLRMDAEGSEIMILRGAARILNNPDLIICMEWSVIQMGSRGPLDELIARLSAMAFRFWRINHDASLTEVAIAALASLPECDLIVSRRDIDAI